MKVIQFFVTGIPSPGGSKSGFAIKKGGAYTGRVAIVDAGGKKTKAWRKNVSVAAFNAMNNADCQPLDCPVEVELVFQMPRPQSHYRSNGLMLRPSAPLHHSTRPDCTKLARSTEDAMTGVCYLDDGQIIRQSHEKAYSDTPGCWVTIREAGSRGW